MGEGASFPCMQPVDAAAAVMDGGLLGASETAYASRATLVVALCVYGLLSFVPRMFPGLVGVWLCLKGLSVGRTLAAGTAAEQLPPAYVSVKAGGRIVCCT